MAHRLRVRPFAGTVLYECCGNRAARSMSQDGSDDSDIYIVSEQSAAECQVGLSEDLAQVARVAAALRLPIRDVALTSEQADAERPSTHVPGDMSPQQLSKIMSQWDACEARPEDFVTAWHEVEISGKAFRTLQGNAWLMVRQRSRLRHGTRPHPAASACHLKASHWAARVPAADPH